MFAERLLKGSSQYPGQKIDGWYPEFLKMFKE